MDKSNNRGNFMKKAARDIEEALEGVLSNREMALELLDAILEDDELTAADMFLCGELRVACMMMYQHLDTLRGYQERSHRLFTDSSAELFNELIDSIGESCEEILGFEALLAGTFSASLRYVSPYAAEEQCLDEFMDTDEPPEQPDAENEPDYLSEDEVRDLFRGLLSEESLNGGGTGVRRAARHHSDCGNCVRAAQKNSKDHKVSVKLVCGADVPKNFERLLKRGIEQAIQDTARAYRTGSHQNGNHRCSRH